MTDAEREWLNSFPKLAPEYVMEQFIPLLGAAWETKKSLFKEEDLEDTITRTLAAWIKNKIRGQSTIAWGVSSQPEILEEGIDGIGRIIGRCDFTISVATVEYIYECKRLWPEGPNELFTESARLYVVNGLRRFLQPSKKQMGSEPQYPSWLKFAGMIGYIMGGRDAEALTAVQSAINKHEPAQLMESPCVAICPAEKAHHFYSTHTNCAQKSVHAHHILLPVAHPLNAQ